MRKLEGERPSLGADLSALADLYLTFLWMLRQRLAYGPRWQYRHRWASAHAADAGEAAVGDEVAAGGSRTGRAA